MLGATATALTASAALTQPSGAGGCVSETGSGPCADGHVLHRPDGVAVSPDGKSVYVAVSGADFVNGFDGAVARFNRNTTTGAITQPAGKAGCVADWGSGSVPCAGGNGLNYPTSVAVSPDGKSVYVASGDSDAVARFNRNTTTGAIAQPAGSSGCVGETGWPCADGHGLGGPSSVAVSPDGKSVYVASGNGVARFNRNTTTGAITEPAGSAGCISNTGAGGCADGHALVAARSVAVSPDGKSVYVASFFSDAVVRLKRKRSGAITQPAGSAGCVSETGAGPCADGHGLYAPAGVALSPDGLSVYVASYDSDGVARLDRDTSSGAIAQPAGTVGCISDYGTRYGTGPCADGHALSSPTGVVVSPDGKSVYAASFFSDAVVRFNRKLSWNSGESR